MANRKHECLPPLVNAGVSWDDAWALRRIAMTLHRWHELECGTDTGAIERDEATGKPYWLDTGNFGWSVWCRDDAATDDTGNFGWSVWCRDDAATDGEPAPYVRVTKRTFTAKDDASRYLLTIAPSRKPELRQVTTRRSPIPDREEGAKKRLAAIMKKYPTLSAYIQGDPRGAALYILRPGDVPEGQEADAYYDRGLAVYR